MVLRRDGSSIFEEHMPGMDIANSLSWMGLRRARHGAAARIRIGVYVLIDIGRIRISPCYLRPGRNFPSDFLTRAADSLVQDWAITQQMTRIKLGRKWEQFLDLVRPLHHYPAITRRPDVQYAAL